ncbi:MAG: hypothetical protein WDA68_05530, partial [Phycisphaerae bacterium]
LNNNTGCIAALYAEQGENNSLLIVSSPQRTQRIFNFELWNPEAGWRFYLFKPQISQICTDITP